MLFIISFYPVFYENGIYRYIRTIENENIPYSYGVDIDFYSEDSYNKTGIIFRVDTIKRFTIGNQLLINQNDFGLNFFPLVSAGNGKVFPDTKWKGKLYGAIYDGSIFYKNKRFFVLLGNTHIKYTTAPINSPILSNNIPPLPLLFYNVKIWKMNISHLISNLGLYKGTRLDPSLNPYDSISIHRYLMIHRFEFNFDKIGIGLTEIGIMGRDGGIDFYLFNPIGIIYEHQFNFSENTNIMWNFDLHLLYKNLYFYSNLFIDDFQYEYDPWNEPNHIGLNTGIIGKINRKLYTHIEYNIFTRWVYGHFLVYQRYIYNGYSLGIDNSSDFDELSGRLIYKGEKENYYLTLKYRRKGETNPETPWPVTYDDSIDTLKFPDNNFLSGNVKKRYVFNVGMQKCLNMFYINLETGFIYEEKWNPVINVSLISNLKFKDWRGYE